MAQTKRHLIPNAEATTTSSQPQKGKPMKNSVVITYLIAISSLVPLSSCAKDAPPTFVSTETLMTLVNKGKTCTSNDRGTECNYRIGDFFYVSIAAVGTSSAGIHFMKSDADKPIYASLGASHGCVIVNRFKGVNGVPEFVFISPKNGVVYESWDYCGAAL